jgi:hypothetical protein
MRNEMMKKETEKKRKGKERKRESLPRSLKLINHPSVSQSMVQHDNLSGVDY